MCWKLNPWKCKINLCSIKQCILKWVGKSFKIENKMKNKSFIKMIHNLYGHEWGPLLFSIDRKHNHPQKCKAASQEKFYLKNKSECMYNHSLRSSLLREDWSLMSRLHSQNTKDLLTDYKLSNFPRAFFYACLKYMISKTKSVCGWQWAALFVLLLLKSYLQVAPV